jgi:methyl-accepting chemotaxis protein
MITNSNRRIQIASFSIGDISKSHLTMMLGGLALVAGSTFLGASASGDASASIGVGRAAQLLRTNATMVESGVKNFAGGGSVEIALAAQGGDELNSTIQELSTLSLYSPFGNSRQISALNDAWGMYAGPLQEYWRAARGATEASVATSASFQEISQLQRVLSESGRANTDLKREYESATRLLAYAEGVFGRASIERFEYDVKLLSAWSDASGLKNQYPFLNRLQSVSKDSVGRKVSQEDLVRLGKAAGEARVAAESVLRGAKASNAGLLIAGGALLCGLAGLGLCLYAMRLIMGDVGRRFTRAIKQFRTGEDDLKELISSLNQLKAGKVASIEISNKSEYFEVASLINKIVGVLKEQYEQLYLAAKEASSGATLAKSAALEIEKGAAALTSDMQKAIDGINSATELARMIGVDASSTQYSAREADTHASDAKRTSQDASSHGEALRDGLLETSKGIKRLGERAQEIYVVADEMGGMSEQIAVLALNANLEAERAGESGAGFRIIANEVQTMARRTEDALAKLIALSVGAQADARVATESLDKSTAQIASSANLSAVAQSMLTALGPLSSGIHAMSRSLVESSSTETQTLEVTGANINSAMLKVKDMAAKSNVLTGALVSSTVNLHGVKVN